MVPRRGLWSLTDPGFAYKPYTLNCYSGMVARVQTLECPASGECLKIASIESQTGTPTDCVTPTYFWGP